MLFRFNAKNRAREVDQAGWGRTFGATVISFIYFFPVLVIIKSAPAKRYVGRPLTYNLTVTNKGSAEARNTVP